jgi:uncharacterized protein YdeI (YjbR/CyaY-like superfamily)
MVKKDTRIDDYIAASRDFARPILSHLRALVHDVCPEVEETMKWSFPHFMYGGILCSMASFKEHCAFGFWKASVMNDPAQLFGGAEREGMGQLGKIRRLEELPSDEILRAYIREAMRVNAENIQLPAKKKTAVAVSIPDALLAALAADDVAAATFESFPPSCRREYAEWIADAKTSATRDKRVAQTIKWLREGKRRNWKYEKC